MCHWSNIFYIINTIGESKLKSNDMKKYYYFGTPPMCQQMYWVTLQIQIHFKPGFIPLFRKRKLTVRKVK